MKIDDYLNDIRARTRKQRGNYRTLVKIAAPHISYPWLYQFALGGFDNPQVRRLEALEKALDTMDKLRGTKADDA